jgi:DNA-binding transcriptional MerR regulator
MTQKTYSIRDLSKTFDVTARALRFYEDKGLLNPKRQGQNRIYSSRDRARLVLVLRGKRVGFSLDELRELLDLYDVKDGQISQLKTSRDKFKERIDMLEAQRRDIDESIFELQEQVDLVERLLGEKKARQLSSVPVADSAAGFGGPITKAVNDDDDL